MCMTSERLSDSPVHVRTPLAFWIALALLGAVLATTVVPGLFTIDEAHYLASLAAARQGRVTMAGTDGLPPSIELGWFDPLVRRGDTPRTPVAPTVPPLWGPLALPVAALAGLRGLALLNVTAFVLTVWMVFRFASRLARSHTAGYWGAAAYALGGYSIEYAQGIWPHALTAASIFASLGLVVHALQRSAIAHAALAGLLVGLATGMRYQNAVIAVALLAALVMLGRDVRRRIVLAGSFALALALPLAASSAINHERLDSWNPISKGRGYLGTVAAPREDKLSGAAIMTWARIVDYSARPFPRSVGPGAWDWLELHPVTGAPLCHGVVKKSWLQSSPWLALGLVALVALAWQSRREPGELRDASLTAAAITSAIFGALALGGPPRDDMMGYNQRYLLDLVGPLAVFFGRAMAERPTRARSLAAGGAFGAVIASLVIAIPHAVPVHSLIILYLPIVVAHVLVASWLSARGSLTRFAGPLAATAIAWAFVLHVGTDLQASRRIREAAAARAEIAATAIPREAAVLMFRGSKDFLGALLVDHDLVGLSVDYDAGRTALQLMNVLLARNMPVFVWTETFPQSYLKELLSGRQVRDVILKDDRPVLLQVR